MNELKNYVEGWKKWNDFKGKTTLPVFWLFILVNILLIMICAKISPIFGSLSCLVFFIPNLSITIRRLHDVKKSGWWCAPIYIWCGLWILLGLGLGKIQIFSFLGLIAGAISAPIAVIFMIISIVFLIQKSSK